MTLRSCCCNLVFSWCIKLFESAGWQTGAANAYTWNQNWKSWLLTTSQGCALLHFPSDISHSNKKRKALSRPKVSTFFALLLVLVGFSSSICATHQTFPWLTSALLVQLFYICQRYSKTSDSWDICLFRNYSELIWVATSMYKFFWEGLATLNFSLVVLSLLPERLNNRLENILITV